MAFTTPVDIANRALQYVGSPLITSFSNNSKSAAQVSFTYDKARRAELRRAIWRFATKRSVLRPIIGGTVQFVPPAWTSVTTYGFLQCVVYGGIVWFSAIPGNLNNVPGPESVVWIVYVGPSTVDPYSGSAIYYVGDLVLSGGIVYQATANQFTAIAPPGANWLSQGAASSSLTLPGPMGYDNSSSTPMATYRLPYGYLRVAPQDRKASDVVVQAVTAGMRYTDWTFEDQFLLSTTNASPLFFRYAGDVSYVPNMDDMFCEGLAARIALSIVEILTQSNEKAKMVATAYDRFMREARAVNAIEIGSTETMSDDDQLRAPPAPTGQG